MIIYTTSKIRDIGILLLSVCLTISLLIFKNSYALATSLSSYIAIEMFELNPDGSSKGIACYNGNLNYGCTAIINNNNFAYPYSNWKPTILIESDYLPDVIAQEMSPEVYSGIPALEAQAIVSRSYANYFINNPPESGYPPDLPYNNSAKYQVFIPYRFEQLTPMSFPENPSSPCISFNLNENQRKVCSALNSGNYIASASYGNVLPAKALFHADSISQTLDGTNDKPYLVGVSEPISQLSICDAYNSGERYGLSQRGANRWSKGNQCATSGNISWSVRWERTEQILVHYFTEVNVLNPNSISQTPPYRWNPLFINWGTPDNNPPQMLHGNSYPITIQVQNTSIYDWPHNGESWALSYHWAKPGYGEIDSNNRSWATINVPKGNPPYSFPITINDIPYWGNGAYILKFDIILHSYGGDNWFSRTYNWPTYDVSICLGGTCSLYLPPLRR